MSVHLILIAMKRLNLIRDLLGRAHRDWASSKSARRAARQRNRLFRSHVELEPRMMLAGDMAIAIHAAGSTGEEQMQLQIDGVTVQTWDNLGGDAANNVFQTYNYTHSSAVDPGSVRIVFTNDLYIEGVKDRNIRVDFMTIDSSVYEAEDDSVFVSGSWVDGIGITSGNLETEWLHADGYMQFAGSGSPTGSLITIEAAGDDNTETMELWISGERVQTWLNIGGDASNSVFQTYSYRADRVVTADQVQVHFSNDRYNPNATPPIDNNLRVDRITIDGVVSETEAPTVFSTGTWLDGLGITPGFAQNEWLHANGYFQYSANIVTDPGEISLASSIISVGEDDGTATATIVRRNGSDGRITVDYQTFSGTATAGTDFLGLSGTVTFEDGETTKNIPITILNDGLTEGAESFTITIDNVVGGATLLVPRTATVTIVDDESVAPTLPVYNNFTSIAGLKLNGDATQSASQLALTLTALNKAGSVFFNSPLSMTSDESFTTAFSFQITGGSGASGADGFAFVLQNSPAGISALGGTGGGLGYSTISNSIAIEFDTYDNGSDINSNHIAVNVNGNVETSIASTAAAIDLNSGGVRYAWVDYNGTTNKLSVYLSATATKPGTAVLNTTLDLSAILGGTAYAGFTAATGGLANSHRLLSWQLTRNTPTGGGTGQIVASNIVSGLQSPTAIQWSEDGRNMYIAQQNGVVVLVRDGVKSATPFIDISAQVNGTRDRGLLDIALHPDFENNPYVYLLFTYDPPEVYSNASHSLAGPDKNGNRAGRLVRVTADAATNYTTAVAGSEVVLLGANSTWANFNAFANSTTNFNEPPAGVLPDGSYLQDFIPSDSESHTVGALAFGTDGALYVSIGDGASYNRVDPRAVRTLDIDSLSGKVLRIDPLTGEGLADNPFYNGDAEANRSKVFQYGLRNPFRITVDPNSGQLFVGDVGWTAWEEINAAGAGANFGWPYYEGGNGVTNNLASYQALPTFAEYASRGETQTPSLYALNHSQSGINAIVLGDVYTGGAYGASVQGDLFFNDLGQGIVRHLSLNPNGTVSSVDVFATGAAVVVDIAQGPDGLLYFVDLDDGRVGRWEVV